MDTTSTSSGSSLTDFLTSLTSNIAQVAVAYSPNGSGGASAPLPPVVAQQSSGSGSKMLEYGLIAVVIGAIIFKLSKKK